MTLSVFIYLPLIKLIFSNSKDPKTALLQIGFFFFQKHKTKDLMTWHIKSYLTIIKNPIRLIPSVTCPKTAWPFTLVGSLSVMRSLLCP